MGRTLEEQSALTKEIESAKELITVGAKYRRHKSSDKIYRVTGLGFLESNDELCVIYQAQYGEHLTFLRPLTVWLEKVGWEGKIVPRFSKI
jgi:hypothetical protein